jgi:hypothetical protein
MEVSSWLHASATLPLGKRLQYPLAGRLGGPQSQPGHIPQPVPVLTEVS